MSAWFSAILWFALLVHILLTIIAIWRVWQGENVIERLAGAEVVSTLLVAIILLVAVLSQRAMFLDMLLPFAALSFIGTIALSRYVRVQAEQEQKQ
jgi:multisubunit Na+/H+ antiporter MnhF subunit